MRYTCVRGSLLVLEMLFCSPHYHHRNLEKDPNLREPIHITTGFQALEKGLSACCHRSCESESRPRESSKPLPAFGAIYQGLCYSCIGRLFWAKYLVNGKLGYFSQSTNTSLVKQAGNAALAARSCSLISRSCRRKKESKDKILLNPLRKSRKPLMCKASFLK